VLYFTITNGDGHLSIGRAELPLPAAARHWRDYEDRASGASPSLDSPGN
jgi:hypothetical protein